MCDLLGFNSSAFQSSLHSSHGWRIKARSVRRVCQTQTPNSSTDLLKSVAGTLTDRSVCCCAGHLREVCLSATQWLWLVEFLRAAAWITGSRHCAQGMNRSCIEERRRSAQVFSVGGATPAREISCPRPLQLLGHSSITIVKVRQLWCWWSWWGG